MSELDDRLAAATADPALAPTPLADLRRRAATRAHRRDVATIVVCSIVAVLGVASIALRLPDQPTSAAIARSGPAGTPLGVRGAEEPGSSCDEVGVDVQAAQSGLAFIGTPVEARVAPLPAIDPDAIPAGASSRVIWTFDVDTVVKGAAPKRLDVTVEWLDADGRALGPRDPATLFDLARDHPTGVLANRVGRTTTLIAVTNCAGYTVAVGALLDVLWDDLASPGGTGSEDPLDAGFAAAIDPPLLADARRGPAPVVVGTALLALAAAGVIVVFTRRRRQPTSIEPEPADDP